MNHELSIAANDINRTGIADLVLLLARADAEAQRAAVERLRKEAQR